MNYVGQHTIRIDLPWDLNAPTPFVPTAPGQVRTAAAADATRPITPVPGGYRRIMSIISDGAAYYDGLQLELRKRLSQKLYMVASYTWSHALNTVEPDHFSQDPNDANFLGRRYELADSLLDQRHRFVLTASYGLPWHMTVSTLSSFASSAPIQRDYRRGQQRRRVHGGPARRERNRRTTELGQRHSGVRHGYFVGKAGPHFGTRQCRFAGRGIQSAEPRQHLRAEWRVRERGDAQCDLWNRTDGDQQRRSVSTIPVPLYSALLKTGSLMGYTRKGPCALR